MSRSCGHAPGGLWLRQLRYSYMPKSVYIYMYKHVHTHTYIYIYILYTYLYLYTYIYRYIDRHACTQNVRLFREFESKRPQHLQPWPALSAAGACVRCQNAAAPTTSYHALVPAAFIARAVELCNLIRKSCHFFRDDRTGGLLLAAPNLQGPL